MQPNPDQSQLPQHCSFTSTTVNQLHCMHLNTGKEEVVQAIELLTDNAKNLARAVEEVLYAMERALQQPPHLGKTNNIH